MITREDIHRILVGQPNGASAVIELDEARNLEWELEQ